MSNEFHAIAAQVRHDLCRHQISEREHVIVDLLLRLSFDLGRPFARLSRLEDVTACRAISKGNTSTLLEALATARIIAIERDTYRVLPIGPSHQWIVTQRKALAEQDRALRLLVAMQTSEQPDLLHRDKSLSQAVAELAVETASVPESGTNVPDLGTLCTAMRAATNGHFVEEPSPSFPNRERPALSLAGTYDRAKLKAEGIVDEVAVELRRTIGDRAWNDFPEWQEIVETKPRYVRRLLSRLAGVEQKAGEARSNRGAWMARVARDEGRWPRTHSIGDAPHNRTNSGVGPSHNKAFG